MNKKRRNLFLIIGIILFVSVSFVSASWFSDFFGKAKITGQTTGGYLCNSGQQIGDVDGNGAIQAADSSIVLNIAAGLIDYPSDICCADANEDGSINAADSSKILQIAAGTALSPGICGAAPAPETTCLPTITNFPSGSGTVGTTYSTTLQASGPDYDSYSRYCKPYYWYISGGSLPPGLALSENGVISGTPTAAGTYNFIVAAADQYIQHTAIEYFDITITSETVTKYALTVTKTGAGTGTVISSPAGINCGTNCSSQSASFDSGTLLTLTATPASGSTFAEWTGACSGTNSTCIVTINSIKSVNAVFKGASINVSLTVNPTSIASGKSSILSWSSVGAGYCILKASPTPDSWAEKLIISGSMMIYPKITTTYTLTCYDPTGLISSDSVSATVTVSTSPTEKNYTCKDLIVAGDSDKNLDIVFLPYEFEDLKDFESKISSHVNAILSVEPFKSKKEFINFHFVELEDEIFPLFGGSYFEITRNLANNCNGTDEIIIMLPECTQDTCGHAFLNGHIAVSLITSPWVTIHEFAHSFGGLLDTYIGWVLFDGNSRFTNNPGPNVDIMGCPQWCQSYIKSYQTDCTSITDETTCRQYAREKIFYDGGIGEKWTCSNPLKCCVWLFEPEPYFKTQCVNFRDDKNIGINCLGDLGCYYGAGGNQGLWRGVDGMKTNSIMNDDYRNSWEFNDIEKKVLNNLLNQYGHSEISNKINTDVEIINDMLPEEENLEGIISTQIGSEEEEEKECNGCLLDDKCYDYKRRVGENYCFSDGSWLPQLENEATCVDNFECSSYICSSNICVEGNFVERVLAAIRQFFSPNNAAKANLCGNEIINSGEECDDGNTVSGDGCSSICKIESTNQSGKVGGCVIKPNMLEPSALCSGLTSTVLCDAFNPLCEETGNGKTWKCISPDGIGCGSATNKAICEDVNQGYSKVCEWKGAKII